MSTDAPTIAAQIRSRIAAMSPQEREAAMLRIFEALEPTDEEIAAEVESTSDEEVDAELRAAGVDPDARASGVWAEIETARAASASTGQEQSGQAVITEEG